MSAQSKSKRDLMWEQRKQAREARSHPRILDPFIQNSQQVISMKLPKMKTLHLLVLKNRTQQNSDTRKNLNFYIIYSSDAIRQPSKGISPPRDHVDYSHKHREIDNGDIPINSPQKNYQGYHKSTSPERSSAKMVNQNITRSFIGDYAAESSNPLNAELFEHSPEMEEERKKKQDYGEFLRFQMQENQRRKILQKQQDMEIPDKIGHPMESEREADRRRKQEYAEYLRSQVKDKVLRNSLDQRECCEEELSRKFRQAA